MRDLSVSAPWYQALIGAEPMLDEHTDDGFRHVVFPVGGGMLLGLHEHDGATPEQDFSEHRVGLDHVGFGCDSRADLQKWLGRLGELGITNGGIVDAPLRFGPELSRSRRNRAGTLRAAVLSPPSKPRITEYRTMTAIGEAKVADTTEEFAGRIAGAIDSASLAILMSIGHQTRLFDTLAELPPATSAQIADAAGLNERYVREWLGGVVSGCVSNTTRPRRPIRFRGTARRC